MKDYKEFEEYSEVIPRKQLTEISGGYIPVWLLIKFIEWGEKIDKFINDNIKVTQ